MNLIPIKLNQYIALFILLVAISSSCQSKRETHIIKPGIKTKQAYNVEIFALNGDSTSGYGYHIKDASGKILITQSHIPAIAGNQPFKSRDNAAAIGNLMKDKILKGIFPPTISKSELTIIDIY